MATPLSPLSLPVAERRLRSRLHQLLHQAEGLLHGSLIEMARCCGNPRCRCAVAESQKHRSLYLGQTRRGKTSMQYVPKDLEPTVRRWVEDFRKALELLEALSQEGWLRLSAAKAKARTKTPRVQSAVALKQKKKTTPKAPS